MDIPHTIMEKFENFPPNVDVNVTMIENESDHIEEIDATKTKNSKKANENSPSTSDASNQVLVHIEVPFVAEKRPSLDRNNVIDTSHNDNMCSTLCTYAEEDFIVDEIDPFLLSTTYDVIEKIVEYQSGSPIDYGDDANEDGDKEDDGSNEDPNNDVVYLLYSFQFSYNTIPNNNYFILISLYFKFARGKLAMKMLLVMMMVANMKKREKKRMKDCTK